MQATAKDVQDTIAKKAAEAEQPSPSTAEPEAATAVSTAEGREEVENEEPSSLRKNTNKEK